MQNQFDEAFVPESDRLYLNVGGTTFITSRYSLKRYPYTRLGKLAYTREKELHFDRNPKLMSYILDLYRTGELHVPRNCCRDPYEGVVGRYPMFDHIWNTLSNPAYSTAAKVWNLTYDIFVALASLSFVLESEPSMRYIPQEIQNSLPGKLPRPGQFRFLMYSVEIPPLFILDMVCWTFFTVEFIIRISFCPKKSLFIKSKLNIMDMILLATVWIIFVLKEFVISRVDYGEIFFLTRVTMNSFKAMRVLRIFTVLYRNEYTKVMLLSLNASLHPLSLLMLAAMMAALIFGALVYLAELSGGSYDFRNVALATWWGYETMTAIGYGKIVPSTLPGYIVAVCCGMFGVVLFAMPIAIMSESFQQYMVSLRAHKHRIAKTNYLRNQGKQNALRAMNLFMCKRSSTYSTIKSSESFTTIDFDTH